MQGQAFGAGAIEREADLRIDELRKEPMLGLWKDFKPVLAGCLGKQPIAITKDRQVETRRQPVGAEIGIVGRRIDRYGSAPDGGGRKRDVPVEQMLADIVDAHLVDGR